MVQPCWAQFLRTNKSFNFKLSQLSIIPSKGPLVGSTWKFSNNPRQPLQESSNLGFLSRVWLVSRRGGFPSDNILRGLGFPRRVDEIWSFSPGFLLGVSSCFLLLRTSAGFIIVCNRVHFIHLHRYIQKRQKTRLVIFSSSGGSWRSWDWWGHKKHLEGIKTWPWGRKLSKWTYINHTLGFV